MCHNLILKALDLLVSNLMFVGGTNSILAAKALEVSHISRVLAKKALMMGGLPIVKFCKEVV